MTATPFARVDHVVIAVRDLAAAAPVYAEMLGLAPSWRGVHPAYGTANVLFGLSNCYLELLALGPGAPLHPAAQALATYLGRRDERLFALAFGSDDLHATAAQLRSAGLAVGEVADGEACSEHGTVRRWRSCAFSRADTRGINVLAIEHLDRAEVPPAVPTSDAPSAAAAVDHVVLFSDDLVGALALWRDTFGIPERWRREFLDRGTINVGLRLGGLTLEFVAPLGGAPGERGERLWGIAYGVDDCDGAVARLRAGGMPVSDARPGLAPATRVATVKWHDRVPTLLVAHREQTRRPGAPDQV